MINLLPQANDNRKFSLLCLGAHSDDIEIGCGGSLLSWIKEERVSKIVWVVFSSDKKRELEAKQSAIHYLQDVPEKQVLIYDFRDAYLQFSGLKIKELFGELRSIIDPDIIFTHASHDKHQDHRLISELTWNTFRNHLILEYEIPKYDADLGSPNGYISIPEVVVDEKIGLLLEYFSSQTGKHWFDRETFKSVLRIRGLECNSDSRYAEAFYIKKCLF